MAKVEKEERIFQLKITLKGAPVKIWRRIEVKSSDNFEDLHNNIQRFMGWEDCHLYDFTKGRDYQIVDSKESMDMMEADAIAKKVKLSDFFKAEKDNILYTYDMGDSWQHSVVLEKILVFDAKKGYPCIVKGAGQCPPEDCGGVYGYADLLAILKDPNHEEYEDMCEWLGVESGDEWDPNEYDIYG